MIRSLRGSVSDPGLRRALVRVTLGVALLAALVSAALQPALAQRPAPSRYVIVAEGSEVRYRVREQLVGFDLPNDAVGVTSAVQGAMSVCP